MKKIIAKGHGKGVMVACNYQLVKTCSCSVRLPGLVDVENCYSRLGFIYRYLEKVAINKTQLIALWTPPGHQQKKDIFYWVSYRAR